MELLRAVPTFTFVDKKGAPFMVVGEDARVTGYFFTEYEEARRILDLARTSADRLIAQAKAEQKLKSEEELDPNELVNPWRQARISTVPLDTAVALATSAAGKTPNNYFQVAASEADIEDALAMTGKEDLAENKVPLFYYENFTLTSADGTSRSPLYFRQSELKQAYQKAIEGDEGADKAPSVLVTELFATLREMVKPGGTNQDVKTLVFVPPAESADRAKECLRRGGKEAPFLLGQRIIVL